MADRKLNDEKIRNEHDYDLNNLEYNEDCFNDVMDYAHDLRVKKFKVYGPCYREFGALGIAIKINDKTKRIINIIKNPALDKEISDESLYDSAVDLANYALMLAMEVKYGKYK